MAKTSAAYVIAIVAVVVGIMGALLLTVADPVAQALFDSALWSSDTSFGTNALGWQKDAWTYWPAFILFGIMLMVWVETRQEA